MAVINVQRWDRNKRKQLPPIPLLPDMDGGYEEVDQLGSVLTYADLICKKLHDTLWVYCAGSQSMTRMGVYSNPEFAHLLVWYMKDNRLKNKKGKAYQQTCYICRLYGDTHMAMGMQGIQYAPL